MAMLVALDFESAAIDTRPDYPPEPCGLAVYQEGSEPYYMAWGHPTENNVTKRVATDTLYAMLCNPHMEYVFHNAPFDCSIIEERMGLKVPWERVHDTMLLAFLNDPFGELSLKPLCEQLLGLPPTERDAVREWLVAHGVCRSNDKSWGAHISKAPGNLVGTYAIGDVQRTLQLFHYYMNGGKSVQEQRIEPKVNTNETVWATGSIPSDKAYGAPW